MNDGKNDIRQVDSGRSNARISPFSGIGRTITRSLGYMRIGSIAVIAGELAGMFPDQRIPQAAGSRYQTGAGVVIPPRTRACGRTGWNWLDIFNGTAGSSGARARPRGHHAPDGLVFRGASLGPR